MQISPLFLLSNCLLLLILFPLHVKLLQIDEVIDKALVQLSNLQKNNSYWSFPTSLGGIITHINFVFNYYLNRANDSPINIEKLKSIILSTQKADGGWPQVPDPSVNFSHIDSSIFCYWVLKIMGEDIYFPHMSSARNFILRKGGIEKASQMTKFILALFRNYDFNKLPYLPFLIVDESWPFSMINIKKFTAQWIYSSVLPFTYFKHFKISKDLGPKFDIKELYLNYPEIDIFNIKGHERERSMIIENLINLQQSKGSIGGYSLSSLYFAVIVENFLELYPKSQRNTEFLNAKNRALNFVDFLCIDSSESCYYGVADDGRYWDTILALLAFFESGNEEKTKDSIEFMKTIEVSNGGIPYGLEFEYMPDADDTALTLAYICQSKYKDEKYIERMIKWLLSMQNSDGGFPAFEKGITGSFIITYFARSLLDSAELYDPSSPDLSGHILEGLGACGYKKDHPIIKTIINYLIDSRNEEGIWEARWAINYIYAIGSIIPGLSRVGYNLSEPWVITAISWLKMHQNLDGGFGESWQSYNDPKWRGVGISTISQTSWALLALLETDKDSPVTKKAIKFLLDSFNSLGEFYDISSVGTGHRRVMYMQYPSYAKTFPIIALSRAMKYNLTLLSNEDKI